MEQYFLTQGHLKLQVHDEVNFYAKLWVSKSETESELYQTIPNPIP